MKYKFKKIYDPSKRITLKRLEEYQDEIMSIMQATRELEEFSPEIGSVIEGYNKKSCDKTMMIKGKIWCRFELWDYRYYGKKS